MTGKILIIQILLGINENLVLVASVEFTLTV